MDDMVKQLNGNCLFDMDADCVVCNNSADTHICNNKDMFVTFKKTTSGMVATIGEKNNRPKGMGTVVWKRKDDKRVSHTEQLENELCFPQSPINIMIVTKIRDS